MIEEKQRLDRRILENEIVENYETERIDKYNNKIYVSVSLSPLKDKDGAVIGIIKVLQDITERKKAEEKMVTSEKKFRGLLENAPDAMVIADQHGKIILVNNQTVRFFGYTRDELIGEKVEC